MKSMLRHRCTIERSRLVTTDGVESKQWISYQTLVRCLLQEKAGTFIKLPSGEEVQADGTMYVPKNTDILPRRDGDKQDRIVITRPSSLGGTYMVISVFDRSGRGPKQGMLTVILRRFVPSEPALPV